jgi:UDP-3-O-[3-hydroxymyristoyl] glucosamine N-acyltransferase
MFFYEKPNDWEIHPSAIIGKGVSLPEYISIGPYSVIGEKTKLGEGSVIESHVTIMKNVKLGRGVYVQAGTVIGCEGQGFERNEDGVFEKYPQTGGVVIGDGVEIGSNSTIVRGAISNTIIGDGSKIGHLTDIGHNVKIGKHCFVSAGVVIGGSSLIGDYSWLAPKCIIRQRTVVKPWATIGLGAVVVKNVEENSTVAGVPAKPLRSNNK